MCWRAYSQRKSVAPVEKKLQRDAQGVRKNGTVTGKAFCGHHTNTCFYILQLPVSKYQSMLESLGHFYTLCHYYDELEVMHYH